MTLTRKKWLCLFRKTLIHSTKSSLQYLSLGEYKQCCGFQSNGLGDRVISGLQMCSSHLSPLEIFLLLAVSLAFKTPLLKGGLLLFNALLNLHMPLCIFQCELAVIESTHCPLRDFQDTSLRTFCEGKLAGFLGLWKASLNALVKILRHMLQATMFS